MSLQTKKNFAKTLKGIGVMLFLALIALNVRLAFNNNNEMASGISIAGVELSLFETVFASGGYSCTVTTNCANGSISCTGTKCSRTSISVTCDGNTTYC